MTLKEVDQQVTQTLQIITSTLFDAQLSVDTRIPDCTHQTAALSIRNVAQSLRVAELPGQVVVDQVNSARLVMNTLVGFLSYHQEIFRFQVSMDIVALVHGFQPHQSLVRNHQRGFEGETVSAKNEQIAK